MEEEEKGHLRRNFLGIEAVGKQTDQNYNKISGNGSREKWLDSRNTTLKILKITLGLMISLKWEVLSSFM